MYLRRDREREKLIDCHGAERRQHTMYLRRDRDREKITWLPQEIEKERRLLDSHGVDKSQHTNLHILFEIARFADTSSSTPVSKALDDDDGFNDPRGWPESEMSRPTRKPSVYKHHIHISNLKLTAAILNSILFRLFVCIFTMESHSEFTTCSLPLLFFLRSYNSNCNASSLLMMRATVVWSSSMLPYSLCDSVTSAGHISSLAYATSREILCSLFFQSP